MGTCFDDVFLEIQKNYQRVFALNDFSKKEENKEFTVSKPVLINEIYSVFNSFWSNRIAVVRKTTH